MKFKYAYSVISGLMILLCQYAIADGPKVGDIVDLPPKAIAQMWVSVNEQANIVSDLKAFAKSESLKLNETVYEGKMIGIIVVTPKGNEIQIINAVDPNRFEIYMTVYPEHESEDWAQYWNALKKTVGSHYRWKDK